MHVCIYVNICHICLWSHRSQALHPWIWSYRRVAWDKGWERNSVSLEEPPVLSLLGSLFAKSGSHQLMHAAPLATVTTCFIRLCCPLLPSEEDSPGLTLVLRTLARNLCQRLDLLFRDLYQLVIPSWVNFRSCYRNLALIFDKLSPSGINSTVKCFQAIAWSTDIVIEISQRMVLIAQDLRACSNALYILSVGDIN